MKSSQEGITVMRHLTSKGPEGRSLTLTHQILAESTHTSYVYWAAATRQAL